MQTAQQQFPSLFTFSALCLPVFLSLVWASRFHTPEPAYPPAAHPANWAYLLRKCLASFGFSPVADYSLYHKFDSIRENLLTKPPSIDMGQSKPVVVSFKLISPNCPPHSMAAPCMPPPLSQLIMQQLQRWCAKEREAQNERRLARTLASVLAST